MEATRNLNNSDLTHGLCFFCGTEGVHRDMFKEYDNTNGTENYADLFLECFTICITKVGINKLICWSCIQRLHNAHSFKVLAITAENRLLDPLMRSSENFSSVAEFDEDIEIKIETIKLENTEDEDIIADTEFYVECQEDTKFEDLSEDDDLIPGELEFIRQFDPSELTLPEAPPSFIRLCREYYEQNITARDLTKIFDQTERMQAKLDSSMTGVSEKRALTYNVTTMLECSNATPFRSKTTHGFPCFFCSTCSEDLETLREHMKMHEKNDIRKVLWKFGSESLVVNVDVTDLQCKLCSKAITSLSELKKHLIDIHQRKICMNFTDRLIPFKIDSIFECQICQGTFETFGSVERHMNVHFRNYVCQECGSGFVTRYRLKVHTKSVHFGGSFPCETCKKIFRTYSKLKTHVDAVHKSVKRFKCPKCSDRFTEYFSRQKHLVEVHGAEPIKYNCNVCDRSYNRRYDLSRHLKKDHLKEKNNECNLCGYQCFTVSELKVHMIKHVGERTHECSVCKKAYARKKTLKEHMKIHTNDRRHACLVCGQAFIQKCSLKGHVKTHHPEVKIE